MVLIVMMCAGLTCHDAEWRVEPGTVLPHNCAAAFGALAPDWLARHPGFVVRRFKCVPAERVERDA